MSEPQGGLQPAPPAPVAQGTHGIISGGHFHLLCADIGGTNSRWAFFRLAQAGGPGLSAGLELVAEKWLATRPKNTIGDQLWQLYAAGFPLPPEQTDLAVLAVAGPVQRQGRYSKLPLAGLEVDLDRLATEFPFRRSLLINDFTAQALAVLAPPGQNARLILPAQAAAGQPPPQPSAPLAIIGAGTGLGKALLLPHGAPTFAATGLQPLPVCRHPADSAHPRCAVPPEPPATAFPSPLPLVIPSEGGHADFPFAGGREQDYLNFLIRERGEELISGNTVVSGRGLSYLHHFLSGQRLEPAAVTATFTRESETMAWAARFYGRVCRNFVLETLATGGLYIAGGVAAKAPQLLTHREFHNSPTMGHLLQSTPVHLITAENSGLWGAAIQARLLLNGYIP